MKDFENNLKLIQDSFKADRALLICDELPISDYDFKLLSAMGLISLRPIGDNRLRVVLTDKGQTYFYDKKTARTDFIKTNLFRFFSGFICGVLTTVLSAWLLGKLQL